MRGTNVWLVGMVLLAASAGCLGTEDPQPAGQPGDRDPYIVVVAMEPVQGVYASQPDRSGEEIQRTDRLVANGTTALLFQANWSEENTGIQLGYALDGGPIEWLETGEPGEIQRLDVPPNETEQDERRWTFYWRPASEAGPGASFGSNANVLVKALVDPGSARE